MHHLQPQQLPEAHGHSMPILQTYIKGDANILGSMDGGGNGKVFEIKEFTADRLTLYVWHFCCG
jgi:hypothetical protein